MYSVVAEGNQFAIQRNGRTVIGPLERYEAKDLARTLNLYEFAPGPSNERPAMAEGGAAHSIQGSHAAGLGQGAVRVGGDYQWTQSEEASGKHAQDNSADELAETSPLGICEGCLGGQ